MKGILVVLALVLAVSGSPCAGESAADRVFEQGRSALSAGQTELGLARMEAALRSRPSQEANPVAVGSEARQEVGTLRQGLLATPVHLLEPDARGAVPRRREGDEAAIG